MLDWTIMTWCVYHAACSMTMHRSDDEARQYLIHWPMVVEYDGNILFFKSAPVLLIVMKLTIQGL
jgi:hypothetical protein